MPFALFLVFLAINSSFAESLKLSDLDVAGGFTEKDYFSDANSYSILHSEEFNNYQATHLENLSQIIPALNTTKGTSRARYFTIRGIGERSSYVGMPNHSVGLLIDDIDYSGIGSVGDLGGIAQVEVYQGPQSTRLGPSALAGMISMKTKEPTKHTDADLFQSLESFNTSRSQVGFSQGLSEKMATRLSVSKVDSEGYINNSYKDEKTSGLDELSLKSKTVYQSESLKATLNIHHQKINNGYDYFTQDNSLTTKSDKPGEDNQNVLASSLKLEYTNNYTIKYVTLLSYLDNTSLYSYDEDWGNNELWNDTPGYNADYDYNIKFNRHHYHYYLEQRMIIKNQLVLGLYFKEANERLEEMAYENEMIRDQLTSNYTTKNTAAYIQNTSKLAAKVFLDYGFRVETRQADYTDSDDSEFSPSETMTGTNLSLRFQQDSQNMHFITLSKGFKAGGFNTQRDIDESRREFDQETVYNLELGSKNNWSEDLATRVTLFTMLRQDIQARTSYQDDPTDPSSFTFFTDNATSGETYGAEIEALAFFSDSFEIKSNLSLLKTSYHDYQLEGENLKGRAFPNSPEYKWNTLFTYHLNDSLYVNTNLLVSDAFFYSNSHDQKHPAYSLVNLTLGLRKNKWDLSVWCRNIFDEVTYARGFYFANAPPEWTEELYTQRNTPRTIGVTGKYRF